MLWSYIKLNKLTESEGELDFLRLKLLESLNFTDTLYKDLTLDKLIPLSKAFRFLSQPLKHEYLKANAENA